MSSDPLYVPSMFDRLIHNIAQAGLNLIILKYFTFIKFFFQVALSNITVFIYSNFGLFNLVPQVKKTAFRNQIQRQYIMGKL